MNALDPEAMEHARALFWIRNKPPCAAVSPSLSW